MHKFHTYNFSQKIKLDNNSWFINICINYNSHDLICYATHHKTQVNNNNKQSSSYFYYNCHYIHFKETITKIFFPL